MSLNSIYELYQTMERDNTIVSFRSAVTKELLTSVLNIMESKLDSFESSPKTRKKVYSVLVECLQNLYHHNDNLSLENKINKYAYYSSILIISNPTGYYEIKTGNFIRNNKMKKLEERLDKINELNKEELRELYKSVLNKGQFSKKGTAGLGLMDIARKTGNKLDYGFLPIDDNFSFFCLNVKINK